MGQYRRRPTTVDAVQFTNENAIPRGVKIGYAQGKHPYAYVTTIQGRDVQVCWEYTQDPRNKTDEETGNVALVVFLAMAARPTRHGVAQPRVSQAPAHVDMAQTAKDKLVVFHHAHAWCRMKQKGCSRSGLRGQKRSVRYNADDLYLTEREEHAENGISLGTLKPA